MKHKDFEIGTIFYTCTGQQWRCTDVGTRTILAIELKPDLETSWFNGPPYAVVEVPFDEYEIDGIYRDEKEAIEDAVEKADQSAHPGFPHAVITAMHHEKIAAHSHGYPRKELLRIERVDDTGEILHPYAAELNKMQWQILVYLPFAQEFRTMAEADFVCLRPASEQDLRKRRARGT